MFDFQVILQLLLAAVLGGLVGLEREYKRKQAGLQTYSLVCLGACLFTILSWGVFSQSFVVKIGFSLDPLRVIQAIAIGIGFIGAGVIFQQGPGVKGLTTAAGLWVVAAIGVAIGVNLYLLSVFATFLTIAVLAGLGEIEEKFFKREILKKRKISVR